MLDNNIKYTSFEHRLIAFQRDMESINKEAINPFFKSNYATLGMIQKSIQANLADKGLGYSQKPKNGVLTTAIFDVEGHRDEFDYPFNPNGKAQEVGSAITYAKRYALVAFLGLIVEDDDDDDDGNKAQNQPPKKAVDFPKNKEEVEYLKDDHFDALMKMNDIVRIQKCLNTKAITDEKGNQKAFHMKKEYRDKLTDRVNELKFGSAKPKEGNYKEALAEINIDLE